MNPIRPAAAVAAASLVLVACGGGGDDSADTTAETTAAPTTTVEETTTTRRTTTTSSSSSTTSTTLPEIIRQPLTGEPIESEDEIVQRAALAVKIDNAPSARRNHSGLGLADVVFEEIVEAQITRFAAVFHSQGSERVGPIRSGRSQDVDILTSFLEPLFAWSGGNPGVTRAINESQLINLDQGAPGMYRGSGPAPHNLYNDTESLWGATPEGHPGPPPVQFEYLRPEEEFDGGAVDGFELKMRAIDVEWTWNDELGKFERSQEGGPHLDTVTGEQIAATNVIVLVTDYQPSQVDARSPEAQTIGEGPLFVFSDGEVIGGTWSREFNGFPFEFMDEDGNPIPINVGNTWVELAEWTNTTNPDFPPTPIALQLAE
ncbi:MAG: DUF3048 domain-containing protein [Actinomycetota bacterium]